MSEVFLGLPPNLDLVPGKIPELDEETRSTLARLIMDESVELPPSDRGNQIMYGKLSDEELVALYQPLVDVLRLDPCVDRPPLRAYFDRASKLGLTPSVSPIYDRMSLSRVQTGLGFRAKFRFTDWSQKDFVEAGQRLARLVGGRPTRDIITQAGRGEYKKLGDFPTIDDIKSRFGRLAIYHELIGYPSCKGWEEDDYLDWSFAFYRQNPGQQLSARIIDGFSHSGRGPSKQPIIKIFGAISKFKQRSAEEFDYMMSDEQEARSARLEQAKELAARDQLLLGILATTSELDRTDERILQIIAQYKLVKHLVTTATEAEVKTGALLKSPDAFVRWCLHRGNGYLSVASIETHASALGFFDDLWPMYRFENVDLTLARN